MKIRNGFVSNSSSCSFIIKNIKSVDIEALKKTFAEVMDPACMYMINTHGEDSQVIDEYKDYEEMCDQLELLIAEEDGEDLYVGYAQTQSNMWLINCALAFKVFEDFNFDLEMAGTWNFDDVKEVLQDFGLA